MLAAEAGAGARSGVCAVISDRRAAAAVTVGGARSACRGPIGTLDPGEGLGGPTGQDEGKALQQSGQISERPQAGPIDQVESRQRLRHPSAHGELGFDDEERHPHDRVERGLGGEWRRHPGGAAGHGHREGGRPAEPGEVLVVDDAAEARDHLGVSSGLVQPSREPGHDGEQAPSVDDQVEGAELFGELRQASGEAFGLARVLRGAPQRPDEVVPCQGGEDSQLPRTVPGLIGEGERLCEPVRDAAVGGSGQAQKRRRARPRPPGPRCARRGGARARAPGPNPPSGSS